MALTAERKIPVLCLYLCSAIWAQEPLRITTRIIELDVVVTDGKGHQVEGLTLDDFTITEKGKRQKIANFAVQDLRTPNAKPFNLPTGIYTNHFGLLNIGRSRVSIILFDLLNMRPADCASGRQQLLKFLREEVRPDDRIGIYTLSSQLRVLHEFTEDTRELISAVTHLDRGSSPLVDFLADGSDPAASPGQNVAQAKPVDRIQLTTSALEAIAKRVAGLPGRKTLVWISAGFPFSTIDTYDGVKRNSMPAVSEPPALVGAPRVGAPAVPRPDNSEYRTFGPEIQRVARAMNTSNIAIYSVDAQGLVPPGAAPASMSKWFHSKRDTMRTFAESTGGRAFFDNNNLEAAIGTAIDETRFIYVLSYYPSDGQWDGHFQEVKVTVNQRGAVVRHRPDYLALPEGLDGDENRQDRESALGAAIASPLEQTGIRMVAGVSRNMPSPGRLTLRLTMDPRDVQLIEKDGRWKGLLDVAYVQQPGQRYPAQIARDRYNFDFMPDMFAKIQERGVIIEKELDMSASRYHLKVVVRAVSTGATGSIEIRTRE